MPRAARRLAQSLVIVPAVLLAGGVAPSVAGVTGDVASTPDPAAVVAQLVQDVGGRGASQRPQRYEYLQKLDSHLQDVAASRLGAGSPAAARVAAARQGVTTSQGDVSVDVYVKGDVAQAADALRALGMRVTATGDRDPQRMVEGFLPPAALAAAAALATTQAVIAPFSRTSTGTFLSQGDAVINGPPARLLIPPGTAGAGVAVGIISDSIDQVGGGIADSQGSGDLPPDVQVLSDGPTGNDEGRAMAEIVYDESPNLSRIVFGTADGGPQVKANTIDSLVASGVKVIADDTSYITEPFFQDDVLAAAVDRAKAAGVAYFISAGNDGRQSWEGTYSGGASEDFDPGPASDTIQSVGTLPAGQSATLVLQWAEPWGRVSTDFALDIYQMSGGNWVQLGSPVDANNIVTRIPMEATGITAGGTALTYGIGIRRVGGTGTPLLKYIDFTNGAGTVNIEHATNSSTVSPDAASARGAMTVAASPYGTPATPETFSSRGPVTRRFTINGAPLAVPETRQKPDIAAPDGVTTSVPGFAPFSGTSAAAPAAAGIAALILSAKPAMSIDELYAIMTQPANAVDCVAPGNPDADCGSGFVFADSALAMALDPTPPVITSAVSPASPDGANGWYRGPVTVTWTVSDAESPVVTPAGCDATTPGDGIVPLTCSATSAGGTAALPVTIKRDSTPPAAPLVTGLGERTYLPATLPKTTAVACSSTDPASGVASCSVTGYVKSAGRHTVTATATNGAGLTSSTTLTYTVAKPAAISRLELAKGVTLGRLAKSGLPLSVSVATASTRLVIKVVARIPKAKGGGLRTVVLATVTRRAPEGTAHVGVKLAAKARRQLRGARRVQLRITVAGSSDDALNQILRGSLTARR